MKKFFVLLFVFVMLASVGVEFGKAEELPYMATVLRSTSNPYHQDVAKGAEIFAENIGNEDRNILITYNDSSEKQLNDIKAWIARSEGNIVFAIDPCQTDDLYTIARELEKEEVYWVSIWEKPEDMKVSNFDYWVADITFDNVEAGYKTAKALFEDLDGQGEVFALQGTLGHSAATARWEGFQKALREYPKIELVSWEEGKWEKTLGYNLTSNSLSAYPDIEGIWAANDNMGIGALEALRNRGLNGEIKIAGINAIPEMVYAVENGEAVATFSTDPYWQGGMSLSLCLAAKQGKINLEELDESKRAWVASSILVDTNNVDEYIDNYIEDVPEYDWEDYFGHWVSGIE